MPHDERRHGHARTLTPGISCASRAHLDLMTFVCFLCVGVSSTSILPVIQNREDTSSPARTLIENCCVYYGCLMDGRAPVLSHHLCDHEFAINIGVTRRPMRQRRRIDIHYGYGPASQSQRVCDNKTNVNTDSNLTIRP